MPSIKVKASFPNSFNNFQIKKKLTLKVTNIQRLTIIQIHTYIRMYNPCVSIYAYQSIKDRMWIMLSGRSEDGVWGIVHHHKRVIGKDLFGYTKDLHLKLNHVQVVQDTSGEGTTSLLRNILMFKATKRWHTRPPDQMSKQRTTWDCCKIQTKQNHIYWMRGMWNEAITSENSIKHKS